MSMRIAAYVPPPHTSELLVNTALGPSLEGLPIAFQKKLPHYSVLLKIIASVIFINTEPLASKQALPMYKSVKVFSYAAT
jgi:hypothetical protein